MKNGGTFAQIRLLTNRRAVTVPCVPGTTLRRPLALPPWNQGLPYAVFAEDDKRQLTDTLYGSMIQIAHTGNDAFGQIDKALGK
jgi:hypothetical protein